MWREQRHSIYLCREPGLIQYPSAIWTRDVENHEMLDRRANAAFRRGGGRGERHPEITSFRNPLFRPAVLPGKLIYAINIQIRPGTSVGANNAGGHFEREKERRVNPHEQLDISSVKD